VVEKCGARSSCSSKVSDHSLPFAYAVDPDDVWFFTVLGELTNKLAPINMRCVLRGKDLKTESSNGADEPGEPEELNEPEALNEQDELEELDERDEPEVDEPGEPEELDAKARHRKAERKRRAVIKGLLHKISAFFLVTGNKKVSAGDVILFGESITSKSGLAVCLPICFSYHLSEDR